MSLTVLDQASLLLDGRNAGGAVADIGGAITGVAVKETITGASTCTVTMEDPKKVIVRSGLVTAKVTVQIDGAGFEVVGARYQGRTLTIECEDAAVAASRRHTTYRKAAAGTTTRVEFCRLLLREEPWIRLNAAPGALAKVELARGSANTTATGQDATGTTGGFGSYGLDAKAGKTVNLTASLAAKRATTTRDRKVAAGAELPENTWEACGRIMGEIGWRVYSLRGTVTIAPDQWILDHGTSYALSDTSAGVDLISWEVDTGKPAATADLVVRCGTVRDFPVGSRVTLSGEGPADGDWLVESITRTTRDNTGEVRLLRPQPSLPEPTVNEALANLGEGGWPTDIGLSAGASAGAPSTSALAEAFVQKALEQRGKPYVWGASGPSSFDCSGLVQWAAGQVLQRRDASSRLVERDANDRRGDFPKPVGSQLSICRAAGTLLTVQQAIATRGALLIRGPNEHIAISLGNGQTIEARGRAYGVNIFPAAGRNWTTGAYVPGIGVAVTTGRDGRRGD